VSVDMETCIGCMLCEPACPYAVRTYIDTEPTYNQGFKTGDFDAPELIPTKAAKCTYCMHRLARDVVPACMYLCPARARWFGDLDDPDSEVSKKLQGRESFRLLEDQGTDPSVYYLK